MSEKNTQTELEKRLVKKISFKSVVGAPDTRIIKVDDPNKPGKLIEKSVVIERDYMRVVGVCFESKPVETQFGTSYRFVGDFISYHLNEHGEIAAEVTGQELFLPSTAEAYVNLFLIQQKEQNPEFKAVELAFDIGLKICSNPIGYEYVVRPLIVVNDENSLVKKLAKTLPPIRKPTAIEHKKGE